MGWGSGSNRKGRAIGYGITAICDEPECEIEIDRGLGYICGGLEAVTSDDADGCGYYFCTAHGGGFLCERCSRLKDATEALGKIARNIYDPITITEILADYGIQVGEQDALDWSR